MTKKKFQISLIIFTTFLINVYGQMNEQISKLKNVIPPSPDASSLGKYGDLPVSLYRGIPQIDIPIYDLKGRSALVPISLSYHASGIKVGEIASSVGLGWSLQAGGVITRSVNGLPDEVINVGYLNLREKYPNPSDLSDPGTGNNPRAAHLPLVVESKADSEPDLYYFSALGKSFKFYFGNNNVIVTQPYSKVIITADFVNSQFHVVMEDGTQLVFGGGVSFTAITTLDNSNPYVPDANHFVSTWYLKSITSPTRETFSFTYSSNAIQMDGSVTQTDYLQDHSTTGTIRHKTATTIQQTQTVSSKLINSIESKLALISFFLEPNERTDLPGSHALSKIKIYSKLERKDVYEYRFTYSYSDASSSGGGCPVNMCIGKYSKRLKLNGLLQNEPNTGKKVKEWKFEYNPQALPSRASFSQDHWGFYNGAANVTLLPAMLGFTLPEHTSGNREPNAAFTQAEILTKITYPTGGFSTFEYEQNSRQVVGDHYENSSAGMSWDLFYDPNDFSSAKTVTFDIAKSQNVVFYASGHFSNLYLTNHQTASSRPEVTLLSPTGVAIEQINISPISGLNIHQKSKHIFLLNPGTYTLRITRTNTSNDQDDPQDSWVTINLFYEKLISTNQNYTKLEGGVRIKSIEDNDGNNSTETLKRSFVYEDPLVISPINLNKEYLSELTEVSGGYNPIEYHYQVRSSSTKSALGAQSGGVVGYGKVTTLFGTNGERGKTILVFSNEPNEDPDVVLYSFPYPPPIDRESRRGLLLSESDYSSNQLIQRKKESYYHFSIKNSITAYKAGRNYFDLDNPSGIALWQIIAPFYEVASEYAVLDSMVQFQYNEVGLNPLTSVTKYFYDNPNNLRPLRTETKNSKGIVKKEIVRTPLEKNLIIGLTLGSAASSAIDEMISRNMILPTLQTEAHSETSLLSRETVNYQIGPGGIISPQNIQVQIANNPPETRVQFTAYDTFGNLLEQSKTKDVKQTYLYDYSNNYPIAEITNANTTSIAYTSFESDGKGNWSFTAAGTADSTSPTGKKCYNLSASNFFQKTGLASSTKYIVSYWYKAGASITVNGGIRDNVITRLGQNGWTFKKLEIIGASTVAISGNGYIDDVRLYPATAQMTTYTYDPLVGVTTVSDSNGNIIYYIYDESGRLKYMKDIGGNVLKSLQYHYKN